MRLPKFLSPSAIGIWNSDREEYYLKYLAENRPPRFKQTQPMSIGASFDAYVKSYLVERLFGKRPEFEFDTIFEQQVESHNRTWAKENGKYAFEAYRISGALDDLMLELSKASVEPRFEFTVKGSISTESSVEGVPLLGKPDLYFVNENGASIILDWKVNGYCSKRGKSPTKGYVRCRDGWVGEHSKSHNQRHKECHPLLVGGLLINIAHFMEDIDESWARQLCIYAWLLGEKVGDNFIICIDQLACQPNGKYPKIRVASHRLRSSRKYQLGLICNIHEMWSSIQKGHIFTDETKEENFKICERLDRRHRGFAVESDKDDWFNKMQR